MSTQLAQDSFANMTHVLSAAIHEHPKLQQLELADEPRFREAIESERPQSWLYYFPFLYSFAQGSERTLLWEEVNSSICLYFLKSTKAGKQLALFLPPFPYNPKALEVARRRLTEYNKKNGCRVVWAEERYKGLLQDEGFELRHREDEFVYDTENVVAARGKEFGRLRQHLNRAQRLQGLKLESFHNDYGPACHELLDHWYEQLTKDKGIKVYGYGYVRTCVSNAMSFTEGSLIGEVTWVDKKIVGFTFGGPIHSGMGSIFVSISDHVIDGLGYLQRHHFMSRFPRLPFFNDSSDTGRESLAHVKRQFRPVRMNRLSQALE